MPRRRRQPKQQELFIQYHGRQIVSLGVLVWLVVMGQAVWQSAQNHSTSSGRVMGAAVTKLAPVVSTPANNPDSARLIAYQRELKSLVRHYLQQRARFDQPHTDWIFLINNTRHQLLKLDVPLAYKQLHLKIVMILDAEKQALHNSDSAALSQASQQWENLLKEFFWLNN